ncbi:hypothetical protein GE061_006380 [Apolygus lucorum]|uniref:Protein takeout n=1 Tax=Apolygus lucorum TaxID=248454 RepID=A0A6A4J592_APOLU|nr:hypothetical protein GE061_006380 [Apolygus lucorum]
MGAPIFIIFVSSLLVTGFAAKLPKNWTECKVDETMNDCLKGAIQHALNEMIGGTPSLGILPLDPLRFDSITIDQGTGPVSIKLDFSDLDVFGVKDMNILSVDNDWKTMVIETQSPKIELRGDYKIAGQILVLPIQGNGKCVLTMDNFLGHLKFHYQEKTAGSKVYYNINKLDFIFDVDKLTMQFDNLFNGDKALGDNMNKFLNENWKEILNELKPNVARTFAAAFKEIGNRLFTKVPKNNITPA